MSSNFPNDPRSPFFDPSGEPMRPMARLSLVRQRLYEKSCDEKTTGTEEPEEGDNRGTVQQSTVDRESIEPLHMAGIESLSCEK